MYMKQHLTSAMSIAICLYIEIREMVSFELGKEIKKDIFRLVIKDIYAPVALHICTYCDTSNVHSEAK